MEDRVERVRQREREKEKCLGGGEGRGTETEVWVIAAQWRFCLISEVSRPIYWG